MNLEQYTTAVENDLIKGVIERYLKMPILDTTYQKHSKEAIPEANDRYTLYYDGIKLGVVVHEFDEMDDGLVESYHFFPEK